MTIRIVPYKKARLDHFKTVREKRKKTLLKALNTLGNRCWRWTNPDKLYPDDISRRIDIPPSFDSRRGI